MSPSHSTASGHSKRHFFFLQLFSPLIAYKAMGSNPPARHQMYVKILNSKGACGIPLTSAGAQNTQVSLREGAGLGLLCVRGTGIAQDFFPPRVCVPLVS